MFNKKKKIVLSEEVKKKLVIGAKEAFKETEKHAELIKDILALAEKYNALDEQGRKIIEKIDKDLTEVRAIKDWFIQELGDYGEQK